MTSAAVNVLPEPVTPSRHWACAPSLIRAARVSMACGWSPAGLNFDFRRNADTAHYSSLFRRFAQVGVALLQHDSHRIQLLGIVAGFCLGQPGDFFELDGPIRTGPLGDGGLIKMIGSYGGDLEIGPAVGFLDLRRRAAVADIFLLNPRDPGGL